MGLGIDDPLEDVEAPIVPRNATRRSPAVPIRELIRLAVESYLEDIEDLTLGMERLQDPDDPVLDWEDVKHELLDPIKGCAAKNLNKLPEPSASA